MFRSHEAFAEGTPNIFGDGYSNWRIFERHLAHPWYHVVIEECLDGKVWPRNRVCGCAAISENPSLKAACLKPIKLSISCLGPD